LPALRSGATLVFLWCRDSIAASTAHDLTGSPDPWHQSESRLRSEAGRIMTGRLYDADLKLLRTFRVIARCGGFTAAQAELNTSQSTISTQMKELEAHLGMRLCKRGTSGFHLTDEGRVVLDACEKVFSSIEDFNNRIVETKKELAGELRIGILNNTITHPDFRFAETVALFRQQAPRATLKIDVGIDTELESRVVDGRLHFAFVMRHMSIPPLSYKPLIKEDHFLFCSKRHPFFDKNDDEITIKELGEADYVNRDYLESIRDLRLPFPSRSTAVSPEVEACAQLIMSGCFIGYLPSHYASRWVDSGDMRPIQRDLLGRKTTIYVVIRKSVHLPKIASAFLGHLYAQHR